MNLLRMTRRRQVVFITICVLAIFAGWRWWTAPRIDPRLVGEWAEDGQSVELLVGMGFSNTTSRFQLVLDLSDDGLFQAEPPFTATGAIYPHHVQHVWSVEEEMLELRQTVTLTGGGNGWTSFFRFWWDWLESSNNRAMYGSVRSVTTYRYQIIEVSETTLQLAPVAPVPNWEFPTGIIKLHRLKTPDDGTAGD